MTRVFAVENKLLPFEGAVGRFVARDAFGAAMPDGEEVPSTSYYVRAIGRGDVAVSVEKKSKKGSSDGND